MEKKQPGSWPEIVFSTADNRENQAISRAVKQGLMRKISPKIYTPNLVESPETIIGRHRHQILNHLFPNGVISHRSALEGGVSSEGSIVISYKYSKLVKIPGLTVKLVKGPGADEEDTPFMDNLYIASRGRAFLENLQLSRARQTVSKTLSKNELEQRLDRMIRIYGWEELNQLRNQARRVANRLQMKREFQHLDQLISALLGTYTESVLQSEVGRSRNHGEPYDPTRIELFASLVAYLQQESLPKLTKKEQSPSGWYNAAFFEAYFSNYIEGTVFEIEEAKQIVFDKKIVPNRHEDSHDVLSTYQIVSDHQKMQHVPESSDELITLLQRRHSRLMEVRQDKMPGLFKNRSNRAGETKFVDPEEVRGTLRKGFALYQQLPEGLPKAMFMMFLIAEVHPFLDGNGRIARIMMNAELDSAGESRLIIPTVFREDYLLALRKLSRQQDPRAYIKMLITAQRFTASLNFDDYDHALQQLRSSNAFSEPHERKLKIRGW